MAKNDKLYDSLENLPHMPLHERAKIFIPFNPLKGFSEALRQKEREAEVAASQGDGLHGSAHDSNLDEESSELS